LIRLALPESRATGTRSLKASDPVQSYYEESGVPGQEGSRTWARLIAQVYEVDPLECPRCHAPMNVIAVITDPEEIHKILWKSTPPLDCFR